MGVLVVTQPDPIIDLEMAKLHLRVTTEDEDALIGGYVAAAMSSMDGPYGWLGRCLAKQTLELRTSTFSGAAVLPYGPIISIDSVTYVGSTGLETVLDPTDYQLVDGGLAPSPGATWPRLRGDAEGVRVQYAAGFDPLPAAIRQAALLLVSTWFRNRSAVVTGTIATDMPHGVVALVQPFRKLG